MTKYELSEKTGISKSFLSDLTNGKANPSLQVMGKIADALQTSLPLLLETTDLSRHDLELLSAGSDASQIPNGYVRVAAILPEHQAYIVNKWSDSARKKLNCKV